MARQSNGRTSFSRSEGTRPSSKSKQESGQHLSHEKVSRRCQSGKQSQSEAINSIELNNNFSEVGVLLTENMSMSAIKLLDNLYSFFKKAQFDEKQLDFGIEDIYMSYVIAYEQLSDINMALNFLKRTIDITEEKISKTFHEGGIGDASKLNVIQFLANARKRLATNEELNNQQPRVTAICWLKSAKAYEACDFNADAAYSALRAVRWFISLQDTKIAISTLLWAFNLTQLVADVLEQGILFNELGLAFVALKEIVDGISCFKQAIDKLESTGSLMKASVLQNMGSAYAMAGRFSEAIKVLGESVTFYRKVGNRAGQAQSNCNLGYSFACTGAWRKARWHYTVAREAARDAEWPAVRKQAEEALMELDIRQNGISDVLRDSNVSLALFPSRASSQNTESKKRRRGGKGPSGQSLSEKTNTRSQKQSVTAKEAAFTKSVIETFDNSTASTTVTESSPLFLKKIPFHSIKSSADIYADFNSDNPNQPIQSCLIDLMESTLGSAIEAPPLEPFFPKMAISVLDLSDASTNHDSLVDRTKKTRGIWPVLSDIRNESDFDSSCRTEDNECSQIQTYSVPFPEGDKRKSSLDLIDDTSISAESNANTRVDLKTSMTYEDAVNADIQKNVRKTNEGTRLKEAAKPTRKVKIEVSLSAQNNRKMGANYSCQSSRKQNNTYVVKNALESKSTNTLSRKKSKTKTESDSFVNANLLESIINGETRKQLNELVVQDVSTNTLPEHTSDFNQNNPDSEIVKRTELHLVDVCVSQRTPDLTFNRSPHQRSLEMDTYGLLDEKTENFSDTEFPDNSISISPNFGKENSFLTDNKSMTRNIKRKVTQRSSSEPTEAMSDAKNTEKLPNFSTKWLKNSCFYRSISLESESGFNHRRTNIRVASSRSVMKLPPSSAVVLTKYQGRDSLNQKTSTVCSLM